MMHLAKNHLPPAEFTLSLGALALIAAIGFLAIVYPHRTYELFVVRLGNDDFRRFSPDRGIVHLWAYRCGGFVMLAGGLLMMLLLILGQV